MQYCLKFHAFRGLVYFPACWRKGQPAPYIHIARTFDLVKEEKGKIRATSILCNMFRRCVALAFDMYCYIKCTLFICIFSFQLIGRSLIPFAVHYPSMCSLLVLSPEDVLPAVYLCTNRIAPEHENKVIFDSFVLFLPLFLFLSKTLSRIVEFKCERWNTVISWRYNPSHLVLITLLAEL